MQIIKLSATDSTNAYLKSLAQSETLDDYAVVFTDNQRKGRGQMGANWQSKTGKNLTFSLLKLLNGMAIENRFQLNICVSMAIFKALKELHLSDIAIKWPNDILSGNAKICGILIENIISDGKIQASIIGIGLNVNQLTFDNLENVTSLKLLLGKTLNLEELLHRIIYHLKNSLSLLDKKWNDQLWTDYENLLFRKDKPSTFKNSKDELFMGFIRGVSPNGKLIISLEDEVLSEFDLKEVKLLY